MARKARPRRAGRRGALKGPSPGPILLVTGTKDCGKTTLVIELIRRLRRPGRAVLALKRAQDVSRVDEPGTDTLRFAEAGADVTGLTWPGGTYVASIPGEAKTARRHLRTDRPSDLDALVAAAAELAPPTREVIVLAEGFSDAPYARVHVLPRPGQPERFAAGPVLATWRLDEGGAGAAAEEVELSLPLLGRWTRDPTGAPVVAAVLAGGKGRRLGGLDKWTLDVGGRPQGERCLGVLAPILDRILVVGRSGPGEAFAPGAPPPSPSIEWLPDIVPELGPLGGLLTAMRSAAGRPVFALAGDMPLLSGSLLRHMLFVAMRHDGALDLLRPTWTPARPDTAGLVQGLVHPAPVYREPLHAIYAGRCRERLEDLMCSGALAGRRMTEAFAGLSVRNLSDGETRLFGDPELMFLNLNTPADLARAEAVLASDRRGSS